MSGAFHVETSSTCAGVQAKLSLQERKGNKSGVGGKEKCDNPRMGMGGKAAKTVLLGVPVGGASLGE